MFRNEVTVNNSHAQTTLMYLSCAFILTCTWSEGGIHALQTQHLKMESPVNSREAESAREVWANSR